MSEHIKYGFHTSELGSNSRLSIDLPKSIWQQIENDNNLNSLLKKLSTKSIKAIKLWDYNGGTKILINDKHIGPLSRNPSATRGVVQLISGVEAIAGITYDDPLLKVLPKVLSTNKDGTLSPVFNLAWPRLDERHVEDLASRHMIETTKKMQYIDKLLLQNTVYANIKRQSFGIILNTNSTNEYDMSSINGLYHPENPRITMTAGNIRNYEQQLICLAGAVAIAHADELVSA